MSRETIMSRIRHSLETARGDHECRRPGAEARLREPQRHLIPRRARQPQEALLRLFKEEMIRHGTRLIEAGCMDDVPEIVSAHLAARGLPPRLRMSSDAMLLAMPWSSVAGLAVTHGPADASDAAALSLAHSGVAETGTLVLASGAASPASQAFLPETHIVVVAASSVVGPLEDAIDRVRATFGAGVMPRSLNLISGPSRTGDIGGRIVLGAHGPRRLTVIVVDDLAAGSGNAGTGGPGV